MKKIKKPKSLTTILIGVVLYFLSRVGIGGAAFEMAGFVFFIMGVVELIKEKRNKPKNEKSD